MFLDCVKSHGFEHRSATNEERLEDIDLVMWDPQKEGGVYYYYYFFFFLILCNSHNLEIPLVL